VAVFAKASLPTMLILKMPHYIYTTLNTSIQYELILLSRLDAPRIKHMLAFP